MHEFIDKEPIDTSGESVITAVIDADSIAYIIGWEHRDSHDHEAVQRVTDQFVSQMLAQVQARQYAGFLSPKRTFRHVAYPEYKAKRKEPDPGIQRWKPYINEYLRQNWGFVEWPLHEADDAVAVVGTHMGNTVMCSPDKDMRQVPGNHFDYKKGIRFHISLKESEYNYYHQLLTGDSGDGIPGCKGIGKVTATQILATDNGDTLRELVHKTYCHVYNDNMHPWGEKEFAINAVLIGLKHRCVIDGDVELLLSNLHTFDLDAAGTSSYLSQSEDTKAADDLFGDW